jgi:hypothetical protein
MVRQDRKKSCWTSPKGQHNRCSPIAVVTNQAVAFDKSMLGGLSRVLCPNRSRLTGNFK